MVCRSIARETLGRVRVRQHVNPLSQQYRQPPRPPAWDEVYAALNRPMHVDIGCGRGRFLHRMAQVEPNWNFLGLEIREPLVEEANEWRDRDGLQNLHYLFCNANSSLEPVFNSLPTGRLQRVTIQFPDPWFKKRHQKRRMVQPQLVDEIARYLAIGGEVFLQSDIKDVCEEMRDRFAEHPAFALQTPAGLPDNPLPVPTEREIATLNRGEPVYRCLFCRSRDSI